MSSAAPRANSLAFYLQSNSRQFQAIFATDKHVRVDLTTPPTWRILEPSLVHDSYFLAANLDSSIDGFTPNIVVFVARYEGVSDYAEALDHAFADAFALPRWTTYREDRTRYGAFDSAMIAGTYHAGELELYAENRYILTSWSGSVYLVQATYTNAASLGLPTSRIVDSVTVVFETARGMDRSFYRS